MKNSPDISLEKRNLPIIYTLVKQALTSGDKTKVKEMVVYIQKIIEAGSKSHCTPMTDKDVENFIKSGKGRIDVGTGTNGQRIYIENGELYMPVSPGIDEEYGRIYHNNFRHLFEIPEGQELRVNYSNI